MTESLNPEFARLLDQYDEQRRANDERQRQVKADREAFRSGFADIGTRVIRPAFEAVGALLAQRGHGFEIVEEPFSVSEDGKLREASLCFRAVPAGSARGPDADAKLPSVTFTTRDYGKTVSVRASNAPPPPDDKGGNRLEAINREFVMAELLKLITAMVAR